MHGCETARWRPWSRRRLRLRLRVRVDRLGIEAEAGGRELRGAVGAARRMNLLQGGGFAKGEEG